jgi:hypothetical protein
MTKQMGSDASSRSAELGCCVCVCVCVCVCAALLLLLLLLLLWPVVGQAVGDGAAVAVAAAHCSSCGTLLCPAPCRTVFFGHLITWASTMQLARACAHWWPYMMNMWVLCAVALGLHDAVDEQ